MRLGGIGLTGRQIILLRTPGGRRGSGHRAAGIGRLLDNAQAAEEAGFDFISVQDHPYVPDFLDTFALSPRMPRDAR